MQSKKRLYDNSTYILLIGIIFFLMLNGFTDFITGIEFFVKFNLSEKNTIKALACIIGTIRSISLIIVFILLKKVLIDIKKNEKLFTISNYKRFRYMAIAIFIGEFMSIFIEYISSVYIHSTITLSMDNTDFYWGIIFVILGVISEVFYYGYKLQEEIDFIA